MANRLASEKSPYLLGHSDNPVDWFHWGEEAFAEARRLDRPIFLSIGYATCHWCHVMEKESFVDEGVAELLNAGFVSVKVDREERPDVDQVYMRVCQTLTGRGGWPLTVIMTPEGAPFFAGTYIPKEPRGDGYGLPGLLSAITMMWAEKRPDLLEASEKLSKALSLSSRPYPGGSLKAYTPMLFSSAAAELGQSYDADYGGFAEAPKFPTPHHLTYLLRRSRVNGSRSLGDMALTTLNMLRRGGIWDHVGGGFHRYSTDRRWFLPHFEKMAYDQAGLAIAYLEAFQATGNPAWADGTRDVLEFASGPLSDEEGGFYCGLDADSEGSEGRFYLWSVEEILSVLGAGLGEEFCKVHGATVEGNFREETGEKLEGQNVLALTRDADWHGVSRRFSEAYAALRAARELRPKPLTDDKILAGWSGLLASAFARAGGALGEVEYLSRAEKAVEFIFSRFWTNGRLLRSYRDGPSSINGFAEDYAYLARACLDLHRATFNPLHLERAVRLAEILKELFIADDGGLNDAPSDGEKLLFTPREATDGAMLSAASASLEVFARLALVTHDEGWTGLAKGLMGAEAGLVSRFPSAFTHFLQGAALVVENPRTLTFSGANVANLHRAALGVYAPDTEFRLEGGAGVAKAVLCDSTACLADIIDAEGVQLALKTPWAPLRQ